MLTGGDFDVIRENAIAIWEETGKGNETTRRLMNGIYTTEGSLRRFAKKTEKRGFRAVVRGKLGDTFIRIYRQ